MEGGSTISSQCLRETRGGVRASSRRRRQEASRPTTTFAGWTKVKDWPTLAGPQATSRVTRADMGTPGRGRASEEIGEFVLGPAQRPDEEVAAGSFDFLT